MFTSRIVKQSLMSIVVILLAIVTHTTAADDRDEVIGKQEVAVDADEIVQTVPPTVVIELIGTVGHSMGKTRIERNRTEDSFDAPHLKTLLEHARSKGAERVVLHIDSPGGYAFERNRICEIIDDYRDEFEFIAFVEKAGGAAAAIALSCNRIFVGRSCQIGGQLADDPRQGYDINPQWLTWEVENLRRILESSGRDGHIADTLVRKELQLWWHEDYGFEIPTRTTRTSTNENSTSTTQGSGVTSGHSVMRDRQGNRIAEIDSHGVIVWQATTVSKSHTTGEKAENAGGFNETNWRRLVSEYSVLMFTAKTLIDTKIASENAKSIEDCLTRLGIEEPIDIASLQKRTWKNRNRNAATTVKDYQSFSRTLDDLLELHRNIGQARWKSRHKERKQLSKTIFGMLKAADRVRAKTRNERTPLSISPVEICQLDTACDALKQARKDLAENVSDTDTNPRARKHILTAIEAWRACITDFSSLWAS